MLRIGAGAILGLVSKIDERFDRAVAWLRSRGIRAAGIKVPVGTGRLSLLVFPLMLARVLRFVAPAKIDLVHVNNYRSVHCGRMVSRWTKVPLVCHVRELITPKKMRQYRGGRGRTHLDGLPSGPGGIACGVTVTCPGRAANGAFLESPERENRLPC